MSELPTLNVYRDPNTYAAISAAAYDERSLQVMEAIQAKGFYTHEIADGLHYATEGWYFMLVVEHDDGVIVVDAPPTIGRRWLRDEDGRLKRKRVIPFRQDWGKLLSWRSMGRQTERARRLYTRWRWPNI